MSLCKQFNKRKASYSRDRLSINEVSASKHINTISHFDEQTIIDKSGKLIVMVELQGIDPVTKHASLLDILKNRRNNLFKSFSSNYALYFWTVRKRDVKFPKGDFVNHFASEVNDKYRTNISNSKLYRNRLYIAIITKQPEGVLQKSVGFIKSLSLKFDKEAQKKSLEKTHLELQQVLKQTLNALKDYQPRVLTAFTKQNVVFSEALEAISEFMNYDPAKIPILTQNIARYLPFKRLFFNRRNGLIELRNGNGESKFAAVLAIKEYTPWTHQGILDSLQKIPVEFTMTQSFRFYDRQIAKTKLRNQQKDLSQSKDESISQTEEIDTVFDDTASGQVAYGMHHLTLICYADSIDKLNQNVGLIISKFTDLDIQCVREDIASEAGFWAQLPGNFAYIARASDISTQNLSAFASLHNSAVGNYDSNYWGNAVTLFETLSGSPYYFNFHYRDVGNFLVFGTMGSGKTVLVGFLILQSMKFGGKRIIFDKDRGLEIMIRAMNGTYDILKPGIHTGFNPCQLKDTAENRKFLTSFFRKLLCIDGEQINEADLSVIENAIGGMYRLEERERQFSHIAPFFGAKSKGSLRNRFDMWHSEGPYAWVFDNAHDELNLNSDIVGFDLSHLLKITEIKTPALMYLLHRIGQMLEGQRGMIFCDEGWQALADDHFKEVLNDWSRTPRKKNNFIGLATQAPEDTVYSSISKTLNESAACKIFFPNPTANKAIYMNEFGLSEQEYQLIKSLPDNQHYFLLTYGHGKESVVIRANLENLDDELAVISGRESTIRLLDEIRAEVGDDPTVWLPLFHKRRKIMESKP